MKNKLEYRQDVVKFLEFIKYIVARFVKQIQDHDQIVHLHLKSTKNVGI